MTDIANRYATTDLFLAADYHDQVGQYVSRSPSDTKPFSRQVDLWWAALCVGVQLGHRTALPDRERLVKFNTGAILGTDPWRITHMELLALDEEGQEVLLDPSRVVQIASEYAMTGLPWLCDQMLGEADPVLSLFNRLDEVLSST